MANEFSWIELSTDNTEAAKSFYADLFGWGFDELPMENGAIYSMFQPAAGGPGGGIMAKPMPEVPTAWMPYVLTEDLEASVKRVEELGGVVHVPPTPVTEHGAFAVIADPSGGVIGLWRNNEEM